MDYTTLTLAEVRTSLDDVARDAQATFGALDARQLNWKPDEAQWSVAQCFEHLLTSNRLMFQNARSALDRTGPRSLWQRLPIVSGWLGRWLIRAVSPSGKQRLTTPPKTRPAISDIDTGVIQRFVDQHREAMEWVGTLDEGETAHAIMTSPLVGFITYSVLDGLRIVVAHDRRHFEQARRVMNARP